MGYLIMIDTVDVFGLTSKDDQNKKCEGIKKYTVGEGRRSATIILHITDF